MSGEAPPEDPLARRRKNKLFNERLKLLAAGFNTMGVASLITLAIAPYATGRGTTVGDATIGFMSMMMLHVAAQLALSLWKSED